MKNYRTDRNNNPAAFTVDIAKQAGLTLGVDYEIGDPFPVGARTLNTARLLGDPVALTLRVIDAVGYFTRGGQPRWIYIAIPKFVWDSLGLEMRKKVVAFHYKNEGGNGMAGLFA